MKDSQMLFIVASLYFISVIESKLVLVFASLSFIILFLFMIKIEGMEK